jgi:hypothetical protein
MSKARDIASAAPAPSTVSATEIGYLDGVTSAIQTQLDAKTAKSTLTTTGDIYYASAANTPARLGIGTASQILAVNSGATAPEWVAAPSSGGMTLISTTTLTGASVTLSSIPATYNSLFLVIRNFRPATDGETLKYYFNGDTASRYNTNAGSNYNTSGGGVTIAVTSMNTSASVDNTTNNGIITMEIDDYANTTTWKVANCLANVSDNTNAALLNRIISYGVYNQTGALSSITFFSSSGNMTAGTVLLYGVK